MDEDGQVFSWGYAKKHGVQGYNSQGIYTKPTLIPYLTTTKILGVSCGHNFTLAWSEDGVAYSWGCGQNGVLGHGDEKDRLIPTKIQSLSDEKVVSMSAGNSHCGVVTASGKVYMFGKGKDLALGLGNNHKHVTCTPTEVEPLRGVGVTQISCSVGEHHGHSLAVTASGEVYSWGDNYKGKLGLGDSPSVSTPHTVPASSFNNEKVVHVSCGGIHSSALSDEGRIYTWGCGSDGRLGHPEAQGHRYLFRSDSPRLVESLTKLKAFALDCSYYHCMTLVQQEK